MKFPRRNAVAFDPLTSFRSLVPGLPSRFYYDVSSHFLEQTHSAPPFGLSNKHITRHLDQRYMLSNEDWKHVAGGYLGDNPNQAYRFLQNLDAHAMKVDGASTKSSTVYTQGYFLNLTQVRLILLLLDAVIILARCYQTFQFMQKVWFGSVARVYVERVQGSPRQDVHLATGTNATLRDQFRGARLDATDFLHPATCSNNGDQKSDGFLQSGNSDANTETSQPLSPSTGPAHGDEAVRGPLMVRIYESTPGSSRLILRPTELRSPVDGNAGRLTACYCCLDAHYLLIILGIGLLLVGLVLLWATDRQVRPGWLLAKTGVYARSRALEDCRLRTNAILKTIQPAYLNQNVIRTVRRSMHRETRRLKQFHIRFKHEKLQITRQYFSELCALERTMANTHTARPEQTTENLWKLSSPSSCALFDSKMELSHLVIQELANHSPPVYLPRKGHQPGDPLKHGVDFPVCMLTPIVPATYAEGHASRMLRIAQSLSRAKQQTSNITASAAVTSPLIASRNFTNPMTTGLEDPFKELDQLIVSIGSLSALTNAVHRILLTSMSVALAMGGMLACLHLAKLVAHLTYPIRIRKINWITSDPPSSPSDGDTVQP
ncbi:hypothetical protein FBUS_07586 [Fasciolopsis buskii]|uniref:Uncharacterized protein n=1 Tax=Fasciolopsis buskii TaxID=27845 RepID=A0A8E0VL43_9TREM|nr:hypothetical protein FBUS_07586 [Fasciolopsis buski]